jgi:hypothetical protein
MKKLPPIVHNPNQAGSIFTGLHKALKLPEKSDAKVLSKAELEQQIRHEARKSKKVNVFKMDMLRAKLMKEQNAKEIMRDTRPDLFEAAQKAAIAHLREDSEDEDDEASLDEFMLASCCHKSNPIRAYLFAFIHWPWSLPSRFCACLRRQLRGRIDGNTMLSGLIALSCSLFSPTVSS